MTMKFGERTGVFRKAELCMASVFLILGLILMAINVYGLGQSIRMPGLGVTDQHQLRFIPDEVWSYDRSVKEIDRLKNLNNKELLASRANEIVNHSLVHVRWKKVDPGKYRQLVPIWENYFLYALGRYSGLPQFARYHYADYHRNLRRGIGICGDASTILSSILDRYGIDNRILSFRGHVIVEYKSEGDQYLLIDPDFGVQLGVSLKELPSSETTVRDRYRSAGYSEKEIDTLIRVYSTDLAIFDDTYHFMTKRYIFENISYVAKWVLPAILIILGMILILLGRRRRLANKGSYS